MNGEEIVTMGFETGSEWGRWVRLEGCLGVSDNGEGGFGFGSRSQVGRGDWFRGLGRAIDEVWGLEISRWVVQRLLVYFFFF